MIWYTVLVAIVSLAVGGWIGFAAGSVSFSIQVEPERSAVVSRVERSMFRDRSVEIVQASKARGDVDLQAAVDGLACEAWGHGAASLREELVGNSGLPSAMVDQLCSNALDRISPKIRV